MSIVWFIVGCGLVLGVLAVVGITRNRFMSQKSWVIAWTLISFSFAGFIVVAFVLADATLVDIALGGSFGFVVAISIHVLHHTLEELKNEQDHTTTDNSDRK